MMKKRLLSLLTASLLIFALVGTGLLPAAAEEDTAKVLFSDDFEGGSIDTGKWTPLEGCPYVVAEDPDDPGNKVLACPLDKAENAHSHLATKRSFSDFTLTMRVYILGELSGNFGVNARVTGDESFIVSFNHTWKGQFGYSGNGDSYDENLVITDKTWHEVRFIAVGGSYERYIDGELRQSAEDSHLTAGPLRISFWNKAFYIDDFNVYEGRVEEPVETGGDTAYYVDAAAAPGGDGLTPETAWNSVAQVNRQRSFFPGDKILFKRGGTYSGVIMAPRGSGQDGKPITVSSYGEGALPIIDASMPMTERNGFSTIELKNQSFWTFENIQIQNSNPASPGVPEAPVPDGNGGGTLPMRGGITVTANYINGQNTYVVRGIEIRGCLFTCIDGSGGDEGNSYKAATGGTLGCGGGCISGVASSSEDGQFNAWIDGFTVENCEFYNYAGTGVNTAFSGNVYNKNVVVRNNLFHSDEEYTASNHAVYICHADSPLVEYNVFKNLTCGMAFQVCKNGTMRYNVAMNMDGYQHGASELSGEDCYWDGCAFDVDSDCTGTFDFYGNFTYNCYSGTYSSFNFGKTKCTVNIENNISYNDKEVLFHNASQLGYTINLKNNTFIRDDKTLHTSMDILHIEGGEEFRKLETPLLNVSGNIFYYPDQRVRLYAAGTGYEGNASTGEFKGNVDETTARQFALKVKIPVPEAFAGMSYCGNLPDTGSFCDSGFFLLNADSDCFNGGAPAVGVDILAFQSGREFWGQEVNATLYGTAPAGSSSGDASSGGGTEGGLPSWAVAVIIGGAAAAAAVVLAVLLLVRRRGAKKAGTPDDSQSS